MVTTGSGRRQAGTLTHCAWFYRSQVEYAGDVRSFVHEGLNAGEPALVALPEPQLGLIRSILGEAGEMVSFADMAVLGRNPARIIPAIRRFADRRRPLRTRFVGEPIWPGRSVAETAEATQHEALINAALAAVPITVLCLYDARGLGAAVLDGARQTHPHMVDDGTLQPSPDYHGTMVALAIGERPLPPAPPGAQATPFGRQDLPALREQVRHRARAEGVSSSRAQDLVMAVHEIAANTVVHAGGTGVLQIWRDGTALVCEIRDHGRITDPLAGRHPISPMADGGHGLRLANDLCDLVELRSGDWGTTIRLHIRKD